MVNFALHNCSDEQIGVLLRQIQAAAGNGVVFIMEYALKNVDPDEAKSFVTSKTEHARIEDYEGFPNWLRAHNRFSLEQLFEHMEDAHFRYVSAVPLYAGRGMILASNNHDLDAKALLGTEKFEKKGSVFRTTERVA